MKRFGLFIALSFPSMALAQHFNFIERLCGGRFVPPAIEKPFRIPVGCEIIDCCPGCPGGGLIDLRVNIAGNAIQASELRLEGLGNEQLKQLKFAGGARFDGARVTLSRGTNLIRGVPASAAGRPVVAVLVPMGDHSVADRLRTVQRNLSPGRADADANAGAVDDDVSITQLLGPFVVGAFRWRPIFYPCGRTSPPARDRLDVQSIVSGDNVVVMLDARTAAGAGGCSDDQVLRTTGMASFTNLMAAAGCNSEVAIFAATNAMRFETPVGTWTDVVGDLHTAPLQAVINMPVTVWIANNAAAAQAVNDVANANLLYNQNKVGVQFIATYNNVSANAGAVATIGTLNDCGTVAAIQASPQYAANTLNVYYVNGAFTGVNCARSVPGDANITYIGTTANIASLPHEIGHAFGLRPSDAGGHTNTVAGFGNNNIMWGGGPATRNLFSLGQAFRMNTHTDVWGGTMLITDGLRPGPGRACAPLTTSTTCPALILDWVRP